jgi:hypothetical protein
MVPGGHRPGTSRLDGPHRQAPGPEREGGAPWPLPQEGAAEANHQDHPLSPARGEGIEADAADDSLQLITLLPSLLDVQGRKNNVLQDIL